MNKTNDENNKNINAKDNAGVYTIKKSVFFTGVAILMCFSILMNGLVGMVDIFATSSTPGSNLDPLVSKSYVDEQLRFYASQLASNSMSEVDRSELIDDVVNQINSTYQGNNSDVLNNSIMSTYIPIQCFEGQVIYGGEGTEIILRSGQAVAYCPGENGIVNITTGEELWHNQPINQNEMIIIPREDGRGVYVHTEAWFMVKGSFTIQAL